MYLPKHFEQTDPAALQSLMRAYPLAALVTQGADGVTTADHIPLEFHPPESGAASGQPQGLAGTLRGHVARANPLWRHAAGQPVLAIFQGPQAYVSPTLYASKAASHKVVPTWNYAVVHAHGVLRAVENGPWLLALVSRLTQRHEAGRDAPWAVTDAPADFVEQLLGSIVGLEIDVTRLVGKWKVTQNRSGADRAGVAAGLQTQAAALAALVNNPNQELA